MSGCLEVRYIGEGHGFGSHMLRSARAGEVLLQEYPFVAARSQRNAALEPHHTCGGCGMILATLRDECERLSALALEAIDVEKSQEGKPLNGGEHTHSGAISSSPCVDPADLETITSSEALFSTLKDHEGWEYFRRGVCTVGDGEGVLFCSTECRERCLYQRGGRFVLPLLQSTPQYDKRNAANTEAGAGARRKEDSVENLVELRKPSAKTIMSRATSITEEEARKAWPTKVYVLSTLKFLADTFNARLRLILFIVARCIHDVLTEDTISCDELLVRRFNDSVHAFVQRYEEGASRPLSVEQRAFLRFSWKCVCRWIALCFEEERGVVANTASKAGFNVCEHFPLQLYLRCFWVTDANAHMFVVVSPLYSLLCLRLTTQQGICGRGGLMCDVEEGGAEKKTTNGAKDTGQLSDQLRILENLFRLVDPNVAHSTGVALYDAATKINHSCVPSVRFVPSHGAVKAIVMALRDVSPGEEVRTSYLDVGAYPTNEARRNFLLHNYGFSCDCPLCNGG
ncbi:unnamed protein product [Trypanosoma congolense IL3000]|uniref:WGS project CAEQ00000000 data, annotated contig 2053 n=1 Tax=Trypanosoma congolense (strain IL3000) TaxID=1068625 RepID=F9WB33_TRYCI|nr:unnamed protein product [Trypanosoma congolense IL3000]